MHLLDLSNSVAKVTNCLLSMSFKYKTWSVYLLDLMDFCPKVQISMVLMWGKYKTSGCIYLLWCICWFSQLDRACLNTYNVGHQWLMPIFNEIWEHLARSMMVFQAIFSNNSNNTSCTIWEHLATSMRLFQARFFKYNDDNAY